MGGHKEDGKILENIGKTNGVCKSTFTLNLKTWEGQKLRRNIKIHGELVISNFHFPKVEKSSLL